MLARISITSALVAISLVSLAGPAAADGEILLTHAKALAGNVTPGDPPGYPIILSIPGEFELASNLFVAADRIGIQVTHDNVTIDLNGFLMEGSDAAWYGIAGGVDGVTIQNGTIANFEFDGIVGSGDRWVVENMQVVNNGRHGVDVLSGISHRILNNTVSGNGDAGVRCSRCVVMNSIVFASRDDGVRCFNCVIEGNFVACNGRYGIYGSAAVIGNYIYENADYGLAATSAVNSGFAHNVLYNNNATALGQVLNAPPLHPNVCQSAAC